MCGKSNGKSNDARRVELAVGRRAITCRQRLSVCPFGGGAGHLASGTILVGA